MAAIYWTPSYFQFHLRGVHKWSWLWYTKAPSYFQFPIERGSKMERGFKIPWPRYVMNHTQLLYILFGPTLFCLNFVLLICLKPQPYIDEGMSNVYKFLVRWWMSNVFNLIINGQDVKILIYLNMYI